MDLDRDLRTRLLVLCNDVMERALERAGARLRAKAGPTRDVLRTVPSRLAAATLGPALVAEAGFTEDQLVADTIATIEPMFRAWCQAAQARALDLAATVASVPDGARAGVEARQADDLAHAWAWLQAALLALARQLLYNPAPDAPTIGEHDPTLRVPVGLVRQALARAGGATGLVTASADTFSGLTDPARGGEGHTAWVVLANSGNSPAGGIGTGQVVNDVLADGGASTEAYEWSYGPATRQHPFEPHLALDGVEFQNFDDPVLANDSGWPEFAYYLPGDHDGCVCDFTPIIVPAAELGGTAATDVPAELPPGIPAELYPTQDFTAASQVSRWMQDNWGVTGTDARRFWDFGGLAPEAANAMARTLDALMREYPEVAERIRVAGSSAPVTSALKAKGLNVASVGRAYADTQRTIGWLRMSTGKFSTRSLADTLAMMERDVATGWSPKGTGNIESLISHEFGHNIKYLADANAGSGVVHQAMDAAIASVLGVDPAAQTAAWEADASVPSWAKLRYDTIKTQVSQYALTNYEELAAESFAAVRAGTASPVAQAVFDAILGYAHT